MSGPCVVVIDQGSTATKGGAYSLDGECWQSVSVPVERLVDGPSVRNDPERIVAGVEEILRTLLEAHDAAAIGLACQRSTCLLWERETGKPLTAALSWQDRSQAARVETLASHDALIRKRTGLRLTPYYSAPKLAALLEEVPAGSARAASGELVAGTLDAFLVHRLTGRPTTEPGIAGRTLLYSLETGAWDEQLCALFGISPSALPELVTSAGERGAFDGIPLLAVAGDQQASLIGHGGWRLGTTAAHFGTGAFVLASTGEQTMRHEGLLTAVLASTPRARRFQIEGSVNSAGSAVDWARDLTGENLDDWSERPLGDTGPWVLPSFTGAAAPWWMPEAGAVIAGLGLETTGSDLLGGVLGGVAHRVLDCVEALAEAGIRTDVLRLSGKLTRLGGLVQLLADSGQIPVEISAAEETGSLGLVRLIRAELEASDEPLAAPAPAARRIEPAWTAARARGVRGRWLDFAHRAMRLRED